MILFRCFETHHEEDDPPGRREHICRLFPIAAALIPRPSFHTVPPLWHYL